VDVGILLIFQNYQGRGRDEEVTRDQKRLAELAEPLGFDTVWAVEHHFTDYSACPDNVAFLSWLAGRTERVRLATGAVIVPWWTQPLRVVERIVLLDHLSNGRALLGLGRGLSRTEYHGFGIDMGESRARFDEASRMIVDALDKGVIEGEGPFFPQARTEIRPRPLRGFRDRLFAVGLSPDSLVQAAELGARLMTFSQQPWELYAKGPLAAYREAWQARQGTPLLPPVTGDLFFCDTDPARAEARAGEWMSNYFLTIVHHYELMSRHFSETPGYELYANASDLFRQVGLETAVRSYVSVQTWGTPEQILEKLRWRRELIGDFELNLIAHYGGMPVEEAERSLRLFAERVLPEVHRW
jgi:alkanesulfonate monooxygenase SsuD/methylene tetrahydromethanopterin reductase-like flavin-dependent oxidoreductase (luciferase family)